MHCRKFGRSTVKYRVDVVRDHDEEVVDSHIFHVDSSGLAGLIRSIDLATNEGKIARAIGLRAKKRTKDR